MSVRPFLLLGVLASCSAGGLTARRMDAEASALARATIETLHREACPRLLTRTFPLESGGATSGKLWVRRCNTRVADAALDVDLDVLGWQWVGEGSWGFAVHEHAYFRASVRARIHAEIEVVGDQPTLRVWSEETPDVTVREIGRVSARASSPAASLLGVASGVFGQGPNVLATSALRSRVRETIEQHATRGVLVALGGAPTPGAAASPEEPLLDETQVLHAGGALISGSYPEGVPVRLRYDVAGEGSALARAVCVEEALPLVDSVVAGAPHPATSAPGDVIMLRHAGAIDLPARACPWVLVTGASGEDPVTVHVAVGPAMVTARPTATRWIRPTVRAYAVEGAPEAPLLAIRVGRAGKTVPLGRPLTSARAAALWVVGDAVELVGSEPLDVEVTALTPRARPWWSDALTYDERLLGRATMVPDRNAAREDRRLGLDLDGHGVGWVEIALEGIDVP
jgi:hypothetical protein